MALVRWNVRIVRSVVDGEEFLAFYEVEQEGDAPPHAIHDEPFTPHGKSVKEMYDKLRHMLGAINQPVLDRVVVGNASYDDRA